MIILGSLEARRGLPISVNWTFFARSYGWGTTSDYRFEIGDFAPTRSGWPKISGRRGRSSPTIFFSQKTRINYLSYRVKMWTYLSAVLSQFTNLTDRRTDRQTDGRTEFSSQDRVCIPCSAVKMDHCMFHMEYHVAKKLAWLQVLSQHTAKGYVLKHEAS